jgi:hypothetical protein
MPIERDASKDGEERLRRASTVPCGPGRQRHRLGYRDGSDLKGFAAANGHDGKSDDDIRAAMGDKFPEAHLSLNHRYRSWLPITTKSIWAMRRS